MKYLLDVAPLIALLFKTHTHHARVKKWQETLDLSVCPITELGFLRISTQPAFGLTVAQARKNLAAWIKDRKPAFLSCDLPALDGNPPTAGTRTTDFYLASLAARHGMELATLDQHIKHPSAFLIPH